MRLDTIKLVFFLSETHCKYFSYNARTELSLCFDIFNNTASEVPTP